MARVLLINPPSPEQLGAPLLGLQYVASALLARGHCVRVIDAAARYYRLDAEAIRKEAEAFAPDVVDSASSRAGSITPMRWRSVFVGGSCWWREGRIRRCGRMRLCSTVLMWR